MLGWMASHPKVYGKPKLRSIGYFSKERENEIVQIEWWQVDGGTDGRNSSEYRKNVCNYQRITSIVLKRFYSAELIHVCEI